jgi:suppressor of ftsI
MTARRIAAVLAVLVLGVLSGLAVAGCDDEEDDKPGSTTGATSAGGAATEPTVEAEPPAPFEPNLPFEEPPVIRTQDGPVELVARNGKIEIGSVEVDGAQSYLPAADAKRGAVPGLLGPTLHMEPGQELELTLDNQLEVIPAIKGHSVSTCGGADRPDDPAHHGADEPDSGPQYTNLHFHGLHVTPTTRKHDGVEVFGDNVLLNLPKGKARFRFKIPKSHEQGTFWYHAHRHGCTDDQVYRGLAGLLIIGDSRKTLPERFHDVPVRSLALKDIQLDPNADKPTIPANHGSGNPTHRTVNGLVNPTMRMRPRETQLWRLANTSSAVWYEVALVDKEQGGTQQEFTVVAQDGNTLEEAQRETSVVLGPGMRADILVRGPDSGTHYLKTLPFDQGGVVFGEDFLATVEVGGRPADEIDDAGALRPLPPFPSKRGEPQRLVFSFEPGASINGKVFDPDPNSAPIVQGELGTTSTWTLLNDTTEWHPIHIHQDDFRVTSIGGKPYDDHGQQDVVPLPPKVGDKMGEVVIEMPYEDFDGKFVVHCHILDHEDGGMMGRVDVSPPAPP